MEGNMRFNIDWTSLIVGSKFTIFALFYLHLRAILLGGLYLEGRFNGGFMRHRIGEIIFGGAYFRNFTAS